MSIYPVPLQEWFPTNKRNFKLQEEHDTIKWMVSIWACESCGKKCKWNRAWGHHSIGHGYGQIWCSKKCVYGK